MNKRKMKKKLSKSFAKDLEEKKGIVFFDFDGTIVSFYSDFENNNFLNKKVKHLNVNQSTIETLKELKKDYLIISLTWWPVEAQAKRLIKSKTIDCFDYLSTPNGSAGSTIFDVKREKVYKPCMKKKYNVLDFIYKRIKDIDNFNSLKLISFEDEPHYFEHIDEFIYVKTQFSSDNSVSNFYKPKEVREKMKVKVPNVNYSEVFFSESEVADGVSNFIKKNLLKI